jgi:hypothetical protein
MRQKEVQAAPSRDHNHDGDGEAGGSRVSCTLTAVRNAQTTHTPSGTSSRIVA